MVPRFSHQRGSTAAGAPVRWFAAILGILSLAMILAACAAPSPGPSPTPSPFQSPTPSATYSPSPQVPAPPSATPQPLGTLPVWEHFPPPQLTPVTPIPPPLTGLVVPEEVQVLAVAGVDRPEPFSGRTDALALVVYHPRLARASVISIPPDLFGYIPGFTMQRMYTAYAVGGPRMLSNALEYNLGLRPDAYAIFNLDDFRVMVDDLGGINVTVLENVRSFCPGVVPGVTLMDGEKALCYMRLRLGNDEFTRNRRQQEVLRTVFLRLVEGGNLIRVPELYERYRSAIDTNLTLDQILSSLPLALKLGDPTRIGFFQLSERETSLWEISRHPRAEVFLPNRPALMVFMQQAIDFVSTPSPLMDIVITLEYELTVSPTPTSTYTATPTPTNTPTPRPTLTPTRTVTPTPTSTRTLIPTPTPTQTRTITPTRTATQAEGETNP